MKPETMTCTMCGATFDPAENAACSTCPLHRGCQVVCCPNCGYTNINPDESRLVQWLHRLQGDQRHAQRVE
ncbi:MAG TPA: hypothetical protein VHO48_15755 [Anaerolineaceae bacterium]|nr:hypothetical protein [Anaerolineaceae bacterium]